MHSVGPLAAHGLYALAWLSFGLSHSVLAGEAAKCRLRSRLGAAYRLTYNLVAILHLALVWWIGAITVGSFPPWTLPPACRVAGLAVAAAGVLLLIVAARDYDLGRLAGTRQLRNARGGIVEPEDEPLRTGGLHRYVRHPLYAAGFLILWGVVDDSWSLATAAWGSLYLIIGTRAEEQRLLARYGGAYADYRRRVPAFLPWKGRAI